MAHGLPTLVTMLRLKGERDDDTLREDEVRPRLVDIEETDELTGKDVFPGDESNEIEDTGYLEYDSGRPGRGLPFRGFAIAAAAFAPTFLLIFFGLPYLVGSAVPARTPSASVASPAPEIDPKAFPSSSEAARGDSRSGPDSRSGLGDTRGALGGRMTTDPFRSTPPVADEPKAEPPKVEAPKVEAPRVEPPRVEPKVEERATAVAPEPVPSLPPARPSADHAARRVGAPRPGAIAERRRYPAARRRAARSRGAAPRPPGATRLDAGGRLHGPRGRESPREQHREAGLSRRDPTGRLVVAAVGGVDRRPA